MVIEGSRLELELPSWCMQTADNSVHCRGCSNAVSHKELVRPREVVVVDGWMGGWINAIRPSTRGERSYAAAVECVSYLRP